MNLLNTITILSSISGTDPSSLLENLVSVIRFIGAGIGGLGLFTLVLAIKEQNPNSKSIAFTEIGVGLAVIGLSEKIVDFIISYLPS